MVPDRGHGGHWRVVATLVGIALACTALWVALKPREPDIAAKQDLQHQHPDYRPGGPECNPQWLDGLSGRYADGIRQTCAEAAEEHRLKTNDLVQQTRSADAAETIVWLTFGQSKGTQLATVFSLLTLAAAVAAAYYAGIAAFETEKAAAAAVKSIDIAKASADASVEANKISQQTYIADQRPWIAVTISPSGPAAINQIGINFAYDIRVENTGKFAAFNVSPHIKTIDKIDDEHIIKTQPVYPLDAGMKLD